METLSIPLGERSYLIHIGGGLLGRIPSLLDGVDPDAMTVLVTDTKVNSLYGRELSRKLLSAGRSSHTIELPPGEQTKTLSWAGTLYDRLVDVHADRTTLLLALGGGVIGDLTGFVAATFMRGIPYVQIPTTLLSQVDSSVGGKTAVNHPKGKNIIGAFYQPRAVYIDTEALNSLPKREFIAGLAEVVKYGVISEADFFSYISENLPAILSMEPEVLTYLIERSCTIKARVVAEDEREDGVRAILNFGHTLGHAVESLSGYGVLMHGEAVSIGMAYAARLSREMGLCPRADTEQLVSLLNALGLPTELPELDPGEIIRAMARDKKAVRGMNRMVLMERIGKVVIKEGIGEDLLLKSLTD